MATVSKQRSDRPASDLDLRGRRILGEERRIWSQDLVSRYAAGASIRELAAATGRSYGFVHRILVEAGVTLRPRGGARSWRDGLARDLGPDFPGRPG